MTGPLLPDVPADVDDAPATLGRCAYCSWEFMFPTEAAKDKGEEKHLERWHGDITPATDQVCEQMVANHGDEAQLVVEAIEAAARMSSGVVDQNLVRRLLPRLEHPQVIGSVYRVMKNGGRLKPLDKNINDDTRSRNVGKEQARYALVADERSQTA